MRQFCHGAQQVAVSTRTGVDFPPDSPNVLLAAIPSSVGARAMFVLGKRGFSQLQRRSKPFVAR
jgi:hypothetical protein